MRSLVIYSVFIVSLIYSALISVAHAKDTLRFIETTGRAVIEDDETIDISRRRALEEALYLAALHGGAKINGFSAVNTDTSIQENLVVQLHNQVLLNRSISIHRRKSVYLSTTMKSCQIQCFFKCSTARDINCFIVFNNCPPGSLYKSECVFSMGYTN